MLLSFRSQVNLEIKTILNDKRQRQLTQQPMNSVRHRVELLPCGTARRAMLTLVVPNKIQPAELSGFKRRATAVLSRTEFLN